jgi:hypothetical protein
MKVCLVPPAAPNRAKTGPLLVAALLYVSVTSAPALAHSRAHGAVAGPPTIAWFCGGPGDPYTCPPQVQIQILGTYIYQDGTIIGRYADDEDPTQSADVAQYRADGSALVLAGLANNNSPPVPGALSALEWYPWPTSVWNGALSAAPTPGYSAYILQAGFSFQSGYAATASQIQQSHCGALAYHPKMIAFYWWTPSAWAAVNNARCPISVQLTEAPRASVGRALTRRREQPAARVTSLTRPRRSKHLRKPRRRSRS